MKQSLPSKDCVVCGRTMTWRKRWARNWDEVRYCSDACRKRGVKDTDRALEAGILGLLDERTRGASICPSEVARSAFGNDWRAHMEAVRAAARRLHARGDIEITQQGRRVDPSTAKGPIRLRRIDQ